MFDNKWQKKEMPLVSLIGMGGGIASPAFLAAIVLNILKPTIFSPEDDTGVPDFDYTAESSAITNINQIAGGWSTASFDSNGNNNQWQSVAYGNGKYVALGKIGNAYLAANSTDGINWTSYSTIPYTTYSELAYGNGAFVAVGNGKIVYSTDEGASWSSASVASNWWQGVTYGDGKFVAVSEDGTNRVATSSDGINWTETSAPGNYMWLAVTYGGGKYVAVSQQGDAMYSSDGTNWSTTSVPETGVWNSVAYGNGKFVAVAGTKVIYSTDGINWSSGNNTIGYWKDITFGDGKFVAVSNYQDSSYPAVAGHSTDGDTWTPSNQATSGVWYGVDYVNGRFIAVAGTTTPKIMWSTTGADEATELTLTDTTVSRVSNGTLIEGESIDQVLTVGETVQADTMVATTVATSVFNAVTYTGNGSTQTIDTGIDLDTGGGLIWIKKRSSQNHCLQDTEQGLEKFAPTNASGGFSSSTTRVTGATSTGYTIGNDSDVNESTRDYASWSFRKAPAFFDVVTYTGQYTYPASYAVPHSLGSVPGMIITKNTSIYHSSAWQVWHKGLGSTTGKALDIKSTAAEDTHSGFFPTAPDADNFYLGDNSNINSQNQNYVAYVFADTPGVIKCGTYTGTGSSQTIDTGFKPKFVLTKSRSHSSDWYLMDSVNPGQALYTNSSNGWQNVPIGYVNNGFTVDGRNFALNEIGYEYIYMAIAEDAEVDITSDIYASGTVSASTGNAITLSNTTGTWSTGMKVQGVTTDTKDYPDPIKVENVSLTSSAPSAEKPVSTWGNAVWEIATDENFTQNVQTAATALSATGTQAGPSFTFEPETGYYARTKYTALGQESEWSDVTYFLTEGLPAHWIATISDPNGYNLGQQSSLVTDSQNNVLVSTYNSQNHHNLVKFDPQGNISWQRKYSKSGANFYYQFGQNCVDVDSNDNAFIGVMSDAPGGTDMITAKYSNSGTLEWQRKINFSNDRTEAVATDSSGSVFNVGYTESHQQMGNGSGYTINVTKHDSSGNHLFTRAYGDNDDRGYYGKDAHVDSSGDLLVIGFFQHSSGIFYPYLQKVNGTDGSIIFGKTLGSGNHAGGAAAVITDSSGNIYAAWRARDTNNVYGILFAKYNSSGTLQWKKEIYDGNNAKYVSALDVDSSDNIYIWGSSDEPNATQGAAGLLIKMDSSGSMVWQRLISGPNTINHGGMSVDTADNIAICGQVYPGGGGNASIFIGKVPSDGSLMGTYNTPFGTYVYAEASNSVRDATSRTSADYTFPRSPLQTGGFTNNENHDSDVYNLTSSPTVLE